MECRVFIAATILFAFSWSAYAADSAQPPGTSKEILIVPPYPGETPWKMLTNRQDDNILMIEWIPPDQSEQNIKDILTEQAFYNLKGTDPAVFVKGLFQRIANACANAKINGPTPRTQNGYAIAYAQVYCVNQTGAAIDADIFIKVISGKDALYVVQREFRRPTKPGENPAITVYSKDQLAQVLARMAAMNAANHFLVAQVQLCPLASGSGSCPATDQPATNGTPATTPSALRAPDSGSP